MIEMPKPWNGYRVIPPRLNLAEEVLWNAMQPHMAEHPAFVTEAGPVSYRQLVEDVYRLGEGFASECGIGTGTRVLLKLWNSYEYVLAFLALVKIGAIPILMNSRASVADTAYVAEHADSEFLITFGALASREDAERHGDKLIIARAEASTPGTRFETLRQAPRRDSAFVRMDADEPALMVYTSGTTGRPKGIVHAHRWVIAIGDSNKLRCPPEANDVVLASGEWSFISALGHNVLFPLRNGISGAILDGPAKPERVLECIKALRVTILYTVPTLYRKLLAEPEWLAEADLSSLRFCNANGEGLEAATLHAWKAATGKLIYEHYGISEMQMIIGQSPRIPLKPGSVGLPWGCNIRVADEDGQSLPPGTVGELQFEDGNPSLFLGYYKDPAKTAEVLHDGWYHTGDYAWLDEDGYVWLAGRKDHCFKSRGYFIAPIEIENACREVSGIAEACALPMADPLVGQRIQAVLVASDSVDHERLLDAVRIHLEAILPRYKVPERFVWRAELPKTALGKVDRRVLQQELARMEPDRIADT